MRVDLLTPVFWPEVRRGTERVVADLAAGLIAIGDRPRIVTSHRGAWSAGTQDGLPILRVPRPPGGGRLRRRAYEDHLLHAPLSHLALRRSPPDVAHAFFAPDALAATRWARGAGRPAVYSFMGVPHRTGLANRRLRKELVVRACAEADAVLALSEEVAEAFERWLGVEARVVAPGVDLSAFTPAPEPAAARATAPTIFCAGDVTEPRKRVALLGRAVARLREGRRPGLELVLTGRGGADPRPPEQRVAPDPLSGPWITWRDVDDRAALAAENRRAWVHALPSTGEAFGLVLAEALACGTPAVGPTAVLTDGVGERFAGADDDVEGLAAALDAALDRAQDPATPAACRARAEQFSTARMVAAHRALYTELLGAPRAL